MVDSIPEPHASSPSSESTNPSPMEQLGSQKIPKMNSLQDLKNTLIALQGPQEGTKLYNSFVDSFCMQSAAQLQQMSQQAQQAAQQMRQQQQEIEGQ